MIDELARRQICNVNEPLLPSCDDVFKCMVTGLAVSIEHGKLVELSILPEIL
jgi:hypothetical protein